MPTPQRLPIVNADDGVWGDILRQYLLKEHYDDGTDNAVNGGHKTVTIRPGTASAGTAPLKFTTGTLLTTPEAGAMEFAGDNYYLTDTSGPTRRKIAAYDDTSGATGDIYYRNSSGYFTRLGIGSAGDLLTVSGGIPSWSSSISNASTITLKDSNFTLQDNSDTTKQLNFELSGISASTTRTLTVPDANTTIVGTDATQTLTNKTLTNPKIDTIRDSNNAANIALIPASNRVYISPNGKSVAEFVNSTTPTEVVRIFSADSNGPEINAYSYSNTDSNLNLTTKGSGTVKANGVDVVTTSGTQTLTNKTLTSPTISNGRFTTLYDTNGAPALTLSAISSAVNHIVAQNAATGGAPMITVSGTDSNIGLNLSPVGTGSVAIYAPSSQTSAPLTVRGLAANINLDLSSKGSGLVTANGVEIATISGTQTLTNKTLTGPRIGAINDASGQTAWAYTTTASVANYWQSASGAAGTGLSLSASGTDTNINVNIFSKGTGSIQFRSSTNNLSLGLDHVASAVNYIRLTNAATATAPTFTATGTDTNISVNIVPKGTGALQANGVDVVTISGTQTLTNKTITSPTITGTPVTDVLAAAAATGNSSAVLRPLYIRPGGTGSSFVPSIHNYLAYLVERGGTVSATKNGVDFPIANPSYMFSGMERPGGGYKILSCAVDDEIIITADITAISTTTYWGGTTGVMYDNSPPKRTQIELYFNGGWQSIYDTSNTTRLHFTNSTVQGGYNVTQIRWKMTANASEIWIMELFHIALYNRNLQKWLSAAGGELYGSNASPPTLTAAGADANVDLRLVSKGSGAVQANGVPVVTTTGTQTLTNKTLTSPKVNQLLDTNGAVGLLINPVASAVNYVTVQNATTGTYPIVRAGGSDTNINLTLRPKGTGTIMLQASAGEVLAEFVPITSAVNYTRFDSSATGNALAIRAVGTDTNISWDFIPKGTGTVKVNNVDVVTLSSTQTLTNKTIDGSSNTFLNLPASAYSSRIVAWTAPGAGGAEDGANTWAKLLTVTPGTTQNVSTQFILSLIGQYKNGISGDDSAIISVHVSVNATSTNPTLGVTYLAKGGGGSIFTADSFKLVSNGWNTDIELWVKKATSWAGARMYESSMAGSSYMTVQYHTNAAWQSATPTGSVEAQSSGVTAFGVPVVTTTGTQTLTNKTLTSPTLNGPMATSIKDTNGANALGVSATASGVNYTEVRSGTTGTANQIRSAGSDTNISMMLVPKGSGSIVTYADTGQVPTFEVSGPDASIPLRIKSKGSSGPIVLMPGGMNGLVLYGSATAENYLQIDAKTAGNTPSIGAVGVDTNISFNLTSKGNGVVQANGNPVLSSVTAVSAVTGTPSASTYLRGDGTWSTPSGGSGGMLAPAQGMTLGDETFTISSGSVTQISGTTINGYSPAIGDRILVANAPATTGTGSSYSMTSQPTNGIYVVTGNTTNLTVSRATDMSGSVKPNGMTVYVQNATWPGSKTLFFVEYPSDGSAFTWGTTSLGWKWAGGLGGQQQQLWLSDATLSLNIWNGTGWSKYIPATNAGTQTLTFPATATDTIVARTSTDTLTNKRITPRVVSTASSATPAINTDNYDQFNITALATNITSMTSSLSGTPVDGQKLRIRFKDDGSPRTITWGASFVSSGVNTLLATTSASKTHLVELLYDSTAAKWVCIYVDATGY